MAASRYELRDTQVDLLRRIADADPQVSSAERGLGASMRALRWRGYVRMVFQGKAWTADITEAGRFYLVYGCHPRDTEPGKAEPPEADPPGRPECCLVRN